MIVLKDNAPWQEITKAEENRDNRLSLFSSAFVVLLHPCGVEHSIGNREFSRYCDLCGKKLH